MDPPSPPFDIPARTCESDEAFNDQYTTGGRVASGECEEICSSKKTGRMVRAVVVILPVVYTTRSTSRQNPNFQCVCRLPRVYLPGRRPQTVATCACKTQEQRLARTKTKSSESHDDAELWTQYSGSPSFDFRAPTSGFSDVNEIRPYKTGAVYYTLG